MKKLKLITSLALILGAATVSTFASENEAPSYQEIASQIGARLKVDGLNCGNRFLENTGIKYLYEMLPSTEDIYSTTEYARDKSKEILDLAASDEYWYYVFNSIFALYTVTGNSKLLGLPLVLLECYKHGFINTYAMTAIAQALGAHASTLLCTFAAKTGIHNTGRQLGSGSAYSPRLAAAIAYLAYLGGIPHLSETNLDETVKSYLPEGLAHYL